MKRLIIHPYDRTTDFLGAIYAGAGPVTLIRGGVTQSELADAIREHDQIIMMGHGTPHGLLSVGQFEKSMFGKAIDDSFQTLLRKKPNSWYIWCHADSFVKHNKLPGFYTGMFISELHEAYACGVRGVGQGEIDHSNREFASCMSMALNMNPEMVFRFVASTYAEQKINPVIEYNWERMGCRSPQQENQGNVQPQLA